MTGDRFGMAFVEAHRARYGGRAPSQRQLTYDLAVEPEYEPWRRWYDSQLALLPPEDADGLSRKLWLDEHFWPVTFELAAGAAIRASGFTAVYERSYDGLTPDWTALTPAGDPAMLVEVHTHQPPRDTFARIRGWQDLEQRISRIPVEVVLVLKSGSPMLPKPPDAGTAKKIARELRSRLLGSAAVARITTCGYTFVVLKDRFGFPERTTKRLSAQFAAPSGVSGSIDAGRLVHAVEQKVKKYADLAHRHDVPLVVAVGAHRFTGVQLSSVDNLLAGEPTIGFQFNVGDTHILSRTIDMARPSKWTMPADLAGLMWLHNQPPFVATIRLNPQENVPVPESVRKLVRVSLSKIV